MAYILNLVLGCWILGDDGDINTPGEYLLNNKNSIKTLEALVKHWNNESTNNNWPDIHYPCIKEHFVVYENLPEDWQGFINKE